jgi:predicted dehydrogenase
LKRLRVAVVGAGVMGRHHANIYAALPHLDLVAVVDPDPATRLFAERTYACRSYATVAELLAGDRPDAVSIAAPTSLHYALTKELLEADIHVLVEKPLATEVLQAEELVELSRARGLILQVGHITRFYQTVRLLSDSVRSPYLIEARRLTPHARIQDVGVVLDLMIHDIDIILRLVPFPIQSMSVAGHRLAGSAFEDVAAAQILFVNGCVARLLASRAAYSAERNLTVVENNQTIKLDFSRDPHTDISIYRPGPGNGEGESVQVERRSVNEHNPLRKELEHFLARIHQAAEPIGTAEDDLRSLAVATDLLAHMETAQLAELEEAFR